MLWCVCVAGAVLLVCAAATAEGPDVINTCCGVYLWQVRYCLHVQQRLLKEQWPIKLAEHHMARTVSIGDLEGNGPGGQVLFNGLRVRMAINTGNAQ